MLESQRPCKRARTVLDRSPSIRHGDSDQELSRLLENDSEKEKSNW